MELKTERFIQMNLTLFEISRDWNGPLMSIDSILNLYSIEQRVCSDHILGNVGF